MVLYPETNSIGGGLPASVPGVPQAQKRVVAYARAS
jgi:hypothetical protein